MQKERAAANPEAGREADYLKDEVAIRLSERLLDVKRHFPKVLDLGANSCNLARALVRPNPDPDPDTPESPPLVNKIDELIAADSSEALLYRDANHAFNKEINITRQVLDDEETLPYEAGSFDMVMSSLSMHWINDLPGVLTQINNVLKPDCPFIGAMLGGDTLYELRTSQLHGNEDGSIPATFRIIYMIGWHESEDQAKPLPRGSGDLNLKDILETPKQ